MGGGVDTVGWTDRHPFRVWLLEQHYSPKSIKVYFSHVRRAHQLLASQGVSLRRAHTADLRLYVDTLRPTAASWNQARKSLDAYYRFAGRRPAPSDDLPRLPEPERLPRPLTAEGHRRFLAATRQLGGRHLVVGMLFATTGARFSGVQRARWAQFELEGAAPVWRIEGKGAGRRGPKEYVVPLHSTVTPILVAWRRVRPSPDWVFPGGSREGHISEPMLRGVFRDICAQAGLPGVVPHQLRHTVATAALEGTGDLRAVGELLGHANMATTQRYTKVMPNRLRGMVEDLPT